MFSIKTALLLNNILVVLATLLMGLAKMAGSYQMLIAGKHSISNKKGPLIKILKNMLYSDQ